MHAKPGVIFLRSNDIDPDPRVEKQALTLQSAGYDVQIIGWSRQDDRSRKTRGLSGLNIKRVAIRAPHGAGISNILSLAAFQFSLLWILIRKRRQYQVIHACNLDTGIVGLLVGRLLSKRVVYDIFDFYVDAFPVPKALNCFVRKLEIFVINNADLTIVCTEDRRKQIEPSAPKDLIVIHNSPAMSSPQPMEFDQEKLRIGFVGTLTQGRFLSELLAISSSRLDIELHVAGFGELDNLFKVAAETQKNVHFYGKVTYEEGLAISKSCDLMIAMYDPAVPNHKYSAPNKFYESLILRRPLITAKNSGVDSLVNKFNTGFVLEYSYVAFVDFLSSESLASIREFETGHFSDIYLNNFSWPEMETRLKKAYKKLLN
ncbi:MAG: hypothetical protein RL389_751 [Actinomycetota bacterium]|jgi:glycosyltransferase involved in cell wall biosynthesis